MTNPYTEIFKAPGAKGFAAAGFLARMPLAMIPMGIVAMLSQTHGEYWLAGAVSATFALGHAFISPQVSRLVDRHGQSRILVPTTALSVVALVGLLLATHRGWPVWTLFAFALFAAAMPSMPAMLRARWSELYRDTPKLHTAFAFESAADEIVYMSGSILAIGLSVAVFPVAGPLLATAFLAVGTALFVIQRSTEPAVRPTERSGGASALRHRPVQILALAITAMGTTFGTAEVTVIAMTKELGQPVAAGILLACYTVGSMIIGLVFGALKPRMPLARQFVVAITALAVTTLPLLFVPNIAVLALLLFLNGVAISPTLITAMGLVERHVPPAELTEGITWAMTGIGMGMAIGSFASGWVIDQYGASSGFWVSVAAGGVALVTALFGYRSLAAPARGSLPAPAMA